MEVLSESVGFAIYLSVSGAVSEAGISLVIFIFGGSAAKAVAMLPAITPAATRVVNNFVFI